MREGKIDVEKVSKKGETRSLAKTSSRFLFGSGGLDSLEGVIL